MNFEEVSLESRPCLFGCEPNDELVLIGFDRLYNLPGQFQIVKCRTCGLMRTNPRPTAETIGFYYPDNYGPYEATRVDATEDAEVQQLSWKRRIKQLVKLNIDCLPRLEPGRVLEIGCASGGFLHRMARQGWIVQGIEFSETAASSARSLGHSVYAGALEAAPDPKQKYDLVVGWMVLEHLHAPIDALKKLHSWTRPDGWLAISIPNAGSFQLRVFKSAWFHLHLPHHLFHYNRRTLTKVLEAGGWKVERIFYQRVLGDLIASFGNVLTDRRLFTRLAAKLSSYPRWEGNLYLILYPLAYVLSIFGQTGSMTVWARRREIIQK